MSVISPEQINYQPMAGTSFIIDHHGLITEQISTTRALISDQSLIVVDSSKSWEGIWFIVASRAVYQNFSPEYH